MSIPTQPFSYKKNVDEKEVEFANNGEGSLVRFRMAGCGLVDSSSNLDPCSKLFSLSKRKTLGKKRTTFRGGSPHGASTYSIT